MSPAQARWLRRLEIAPRSKADNLVGATTKRVCHQRGWAELRPLKDRPVFDAWQITEAGRAALRAEE